MERTPHGSGLEEGSGKATSLAEPRKEQSSKTSVNAKGRGFELTRLGSR